MRILVNYNPREKEYLSSLAYQLRGHNLTAVSSSATMTISELLAKAKIGNCDAILLCNEDTLRNLVPGDKPTLDKWRGSRLLFSTPVIVCNSLAHIHTVNHGQWLLDKDLSKFKHLGRKPTPFVHTVLERTEQFEDAYSVLSKALIIVPDIETATQKEDEDSLQAGITWISCSGYTAIMPDLSLVTYVLPLVDFGEDHWRDDDSYIQAIQLMQDINALPQAKCMHNGIYDATHALRYRAPYNNYTLDTMAFAHAEFAELPKTLDFVASYQLYDYIFWKDDSESASKNKDIKKYWSYNGKDTWNTARILLEQLKTMPAYARTNFASKFKLVYPALYCNFEGFLIDQGVRTKLRTESSVILDRALKKLQIMFADKNFNPGSWQQVQKYIYKVFGAKNPKIGKSKSGTDEKNLLVVAEQHPLLAVLCTEILDYRGAQKAIGTYYDFLQYNGRLLWALNPWGTETERMACSASSLWCGTQVQNIPSYAKPMLIVDKGFELVEVDNSQSEARCTAYCAQEEALIAALENKERDFYKTLGTLFFKMNYEDVTDFFRNKVLKKIVHGTNYMMGAKTFTENIGIKILYETAALLGIKLVPVPMKNKKNEKTISGFAKGLLEEYHIPFPRVRLWYKELYNEILTKGTITSPFGHVRKFFGNIAKSHQILTGAVAHQPQNLSVEVLNIGLWKVYTQIVLPSNGEFRLKAQIHDSILAQYKKEKRDYYVGKMIECMTNPVVVHGRTLRIPLDAKVGSSWGDMKKYKVPTKELVNGN